MPVPHQFVALHVSAVPDAAPAVPYGGWPRSLSARKVPQRPCAPRNLHWPWQHATVWCPLVLSKKGAEK